MEQALPTSRTLAAAGGLPGLHAQPLRGRQGASASSCLLLLHSSPPLPQRSHTVLAVTAALTLLELAGGRSRASPRWRVAGLPPRAQLWLGRAAMAGFIALLAYETMHSNRPAFATLFYTWF